MRVLFTTIPGYGHFHPLVPFARALADAGHELAVATHAASASAVAHSGFRHVPAGFQGDFHAVFPQARTMAVPDFVAFMQREIFGAFRPRHMVPDLLAFAATWRPDLIVREEREYGGCIAAEALGLPMPRCA